MLERLSSVYFRAFIMISVFFICVVCDFRRQYPLKTSVVSSQNIVTRDLKILELHIIITLIYGLKTTS